MVLSRFKLSFALSFITVFLLFAGCQALLKTGFEEGLSDQKKSAVASNGEILLNSISVTSSLPFDIPVISMAKSNALNLMFDEFSDQPHTFSIRFSHRNSDWSRSQLITTQFLSGPNELTINNRTLNTSGDTTFYTHAYNFPNRDVRFLKSGNYLAEILNFETGKQVLSFKFYVTEQSGDLTTEIRERSLTGYATRRQHRLLIDYNPDFQILFPDSELKLITKQNSINGPQKRDFNIDLTDPEIIKWFQDDDALFLANNQVRTLNLRSFNSDDVFERFEDAEAIPFIDLQPDEQDFTDVNTAFTTFHDINFRPGAEYANVRFNFRSSDQFQPQKPVYLMFYSTVDGPKFIPMSVDKDGNYSTVTTLRQGFYSYKYVTETNPDRPQTALDIPFAQTRNVYTVLLYYRNPHEYFDRLLQAQVIVSK